jgi:hypothetical protein
LPLESSPTPRRPRRPWRGLGGGSGCWENGEDGTLAELSAAERISRSYICRVLRLTLLAPVGNVDAAIGVDADQVIVEGSMMDLRECDAVGEHLLVVKTRATTLQAPPSAVRGPPLTFTCLDPDYSPGPAYSLSNTSKQYRIDPVR